MVVIDIENKVIDTIENAYAAAQEILTVYGAASLEELEYPCVVVLELDNTDYGRSMDDSLVPRHARVLYQLDFYSNTPGAAKANAKRYMAIADDAMHSMKFTRTSMDFFPEDALGVVRYVARYSAIVEIPKTVGQNTVYQMYR